MEKINSINKQSAKWLRWTARGIGSFGGVFWLFSLIANAIGEISAGTPPPLEGIILGVLIIILVVGVIIAWRNEKIGGTIVTFGAIALCIFAYITAGRNKHLAVLFSGAPFLVSGILFLTSWRRSKK